MSDDVEAHVLPRMLEQLQAQELGVSVLVRQSNRYTVESLLTEGSVDLAIGALPGLAESFHQEGLFNSGYACLYDGDRLGLSTPLGLEDYLAMAHLLVSYDGRRGIVDDLLEARGLRRRIIGSTTHFVRRRNPPAQRRRGRHPPPPRRAGLRRGHRADLVGAADPHAAILRLDGLDAPAPKQSSPAVAARLHPPLPRQLTQLESYFWLVTPPQKARPKPQASETYGSADGSRLISGSMRPLPP